MARTPARPDGANLEPPVLATGGFFVGAWGLQTCGCHRPRLSACPARLRPCVLGSLGFRNPATHKVRAHRISFLPLEPDVTSGPTVAAMDEKQWKIGELAAATGM